MCLLLCLYKPLIKRSEKMGNVHGGSVPLRSIQESSVDELGDYSQGPYWNEKPDGEAVIRYAKKGLGSKELGLAITIIEMLANAATKCGTRMALAQEPPSKVGLNGNKVPPPIPREEWRTWTWAQYLKDVRRAARSMMALGFVQYDSCTIVGFVSCTYNM